MDTQLNMHCVKETTGLPFAQPLLPALIEQTARQVFETFSEKMKATLNGRQERALKMALEGHVTRKAERIFSVRGEDGQHSYLVNLEARTCTCPDSQKGNVCKHRLAAYLVEQADKATREMASQPSPQVDPSDEDDAEIEAIEKARLVIHARSEFLREGIVYAMLDLDGQSLQVEVLDIEGDVALIRALPKHKDGKLIPQFPFPDKKSFAKVLAKSLHEVRIYR